MSEPTQAPDATEPLSTSTTVDAEEPFDASATNADLVLHSSDSIDFFVMKSILSLASSVLNGIILSNQGEGNLVNMKNGLPMVRLEEDSVTLYNLLQLIYPYGMEPSNIEVCVKVGQAAEKYAMNGVVQRLRRIIPTCEALAKEPLRAFAIAVHFGWVEMIKDAAWNTLAIPLCDLNRCDELRMLSGADYHDLLQWRFACEKTLHELLTGWKMGYPSGPIGALAMAQRIQEKLKETGCPRSVTLMDESVPSRAFERAKSDISFQEILESAKAVAAQIDEKVSKVPMTIRDKWVVPPPRPALPVDRPAPAPPHTQGPKSETAASLQPSEPPTPPPVIPASADSYLGAEESDMAIMAPKTTKKTKKR